MRLSRPMPLRHFLHIGANLLRQIGDLVDEGDLGREERIGRIFRQFGSAAIGKKYRRRIEMKRPVDFGHDAPGARIVRSDHDPVRMLEIPDRGTLAQKFGI